MCTKLSSCDILKYFTSSQSCLVMSYRPIDTPQLIIRVVLSLFFKFLLAKELF
jgi:hypothetical protein